MDFGDCGTSHSQKLAQTTSKILKMVVLVPTTKPTQIMMEREVVLTTPSWEFSHKSMGDVMIFPQNEGAFFGHKVPGFHSKLAISGAKMAPFHPKNNKKHNFYVKPAKLLANEPAGMELGIFLCQKHI